jgi:hypothetical protein
MDARLRGVCSCNGGKGDAGEGDAVFGVLGVSGVEVDALFIARRLRAIVTRIQKLNCDGTRLESNTEQCAP